MKSETISGNITKGQDGKCKSSWPCSKSNCPLRKSLWVMCQPSWRISVLTFNTLIFIVLSTLICEKKPRAKISLHYDKLVALKTFFFCSSSLWFNVMWTHLLCCVLCPWWKPVMKTRIIIRFSSRIIAKCHEVMRISVLAASSDLKWSSTFSQRQYKNLYKAAKTSSDTHCQKCYLFSRGEGSRKN